VSLRPPVSPLSRPSNGAILSVTENPRCAWLLHPTRSPAEDPGPEQPGSVDAVGAVRRLPIRAGGCWACGASGAGLMALAWPPEPGPGHLPHGPEPSVAKPLPRPAYRTSRAARRDRDTPISRHFACARVDSNHHGPLSPQSPQPRSRLQDGSAGVRIVRFARFRGRIGRIWRGEPCRDVATDRARAETVVGRRVVCTTHHRVAAAVAVLIPGRSDVQSVYSASFLSGPRTKSTPGEPFNRPHLAEKLRCSLWESGAS
jgi:hypothetical protein